MNTCRDADCERPIYARGLCSRHSASHRRRAIAYGRWDPWVTDTAPLLDHLEQLTRFGLSAAKISALSGVSVTSVVVILRDRPARVRRTTADRLLAAMPLLQNLPRGSQIGATGTHRRLQALVTLGWTQVGLDRMLAFPRGRVNDILHSSRVLVAHHLAIAALFDQLWHTPAPERTAAERRAATRARQYAARNGWLAPLAWDDPDTDPQPPLQDGAAELVDDLAVELACDWASVKLNYAERRAAVARLTHQQLSDAQIAERLGLSSRTALRIRHEPTFPTLEMEDQVVA